MLSKSAERFTNAMDFCCNVARRYQATNSATVTLLARSSSARSTMIGPGSASIKALPSFLRVSALSSVTRAEDKDKEKDKPAKKGGDS